MLSTTWQDVKRTVRFLIRSPLFAVTAIASLAIGIAGTATLFGFVDALLLRPLPRVAEANTLVEVGRTRRGDGFETFSYPDYLDYRDRATVFAGFAAYRNGGKFGLTVDQGAARVAGGSVSANYFDVLGVPIQHGRSFRPEDDRPGAEAAVVISDELWREQFNADPQVIGRTVRLNGMAFTVVGITAPGFSGHTIVFEDLWIPVTAYPEGGDTSVLSRRDAAWLRGVAKLKSGVTRAQADSELQAIASGLAQANTASTPDSRLTVAPLSPVPHDAMSALRGFLVLLTVLIALILAIACTNIAGMMVARSIARWRELAVRLALGAPRRHLIKLLLVESLVIAGAGVGLGLLIANAVAPMLERATSLLPVDVVLDLQINWRVVAFSILVGVFSAALCGSAAGIHVARLPLTSILRLDGADAPSRLLARRAFVVAQVAFSVLLVICALSLGRSLRNAETVDVGFVPDGVEVASIDLRLGGYDQASAPVFADTLVSRLREVPNVQAAAVGRVLPLRAEGYSAGLVWRPGDPRDVEHGIKADWNLITTDFFRTLSLPLISGRSFNASDVAGAEPVAIVNETFARRAWPGQEAVGQIAVFGNEGRPLRIVGIARDAKYRSVFERPRPFIYVPLAQHPTNELWLMMRTREQTAIPALRAIVQQMNPALPVARTGTLREANAFALVPQRVAAWVTMGVGLIGLLLAAIGVYGVTAYEVGLRRREIGVRVALGAAPTRIVRMLVRHAAILSIIGTVIGLVLAAAATQLLRGLLFGVEAFDPISFAVGILVLFAVALSASLFPARRAATLAASEAIRAL